MLVALGAGLLAAPASLVAQPTGRVPRIGFLGAADAAGYAAHLQGFRRGLREHGYEEGRNLVVEYKWAEGQYDRLLALAQELVRSKVDIIVTHGTPGTLAAKAATTTIPIVMAIIGDAVATGIVPSISRPGGNITGSSFFAPELAAKRLELLREALPRLSRVAVLVKPGNPIFGPTLKAMEATAKALKLDLQQFAVRSPAEFDNAFTAMVKSGAGALVVFEDAMFNANIGAIVNLAAMHRLVAVGGTEFADAGGPLGYGVNFPEIFRRASYYIDRILKGAKPADLPIEQPTQFLFIVNLRSAAAVGFTIPPSVMVRADRVIK